MNVRNDRWNEEKLTNLVETKHTKAEIIKSLGLPDTGGNRRTLDRYLRFYGLTVRNRVELSLKNYCNEHGITIEQIVSEVKSVREFLNLIGMSQTGSSHKSAVKILTDYDCSHFTGQGWSKGKTYATSDQVKIITDKLSIENSELFVENSKSGTSVVRKRILRDKLLPYECSICGLYEWRGTDITLHLDHINGVSNDHRIENLRFLCPNCHQQTETWGNGSI